MPAFCAAIAQDGRGVLLLDQVGMHCIGTARQPHALVAGYDTIIGASAPRPYFSVGPLMSPRDHYWIRFACTAALSHEHTALTVEIGSNHWRCELSSDALRPLIVRMTRPKVWFITGASRGFGRAWTFAALEREDRVAAVARDSTALKDLARTFGDA